MHKLKPGKLSEREEKLHAIILFETHGNCQFRIGGVAIMLEMASYSLSGNWKGSLVRAADLVSC